MSPHLAFMSIRAAMTCGRLRSAWDRETRESAHRATWRQPSWEERAREREEAGGATDQEPR
ncbi:unnamed protein product [Spirodela intermedia]|uniref:Uncharacterized protein n=2 Tax=Spirodela intermedia TaxID=51605 RepID=A0A7I8IUJ3_SPIIN|nr:unnamed protein product [Spirodela intermedia]CAA6660637.1 unnamed protein product [Spirodela intermedia]CAA7397005.1 unnamed protein product [Spirodela intermedia]